MVEVSIYRGSNSESPRLYLGRLQGFALISETREVTVPAGPVIVRFEGVASGIEPASALVKGIGIDEKNQNANLLSQRGLLDHFTGQQVTIRRTNPFTGKIIEEQATIRSGSDRLLIQTDQGFEAVACTGLNQTLVFDRAPQNLSAKPTLSVRIPDQPGGTYTMTLTYLASNFDWRANYVAELNDEGTRADILGWLTMASSDSTSFFDARANAVAGEVYRENEDYENTLFSSGFRPVRYQCWPSESTGQFTEGLYQRRPFAISTAPSPTARRQESDLLEGPFDGGVILVTGSRIAQREDLGDLKLYRIPFPTTVAANSQKQVAFIQKQNVEGEIIYQLEIGRGDNFDRINRVFRATNKEENGLGEPLPSGQFAFFQQILGLRQLVGEDRMDDKAVGEEVELDLGLASNVIASIERGWWDEKNDRWEEFTLTVRNASPLPITFESEFLDDEDYEHKRFNQRMRKRDGRPLWRTEVPANGVVDLRYRAYEKEMSD
ncbi:DUF4139 domain-containing protein [Erythrobacter rubeus]|uniref:DUF4139 domain-containing protein n=1 Tax=Erythrobacter rubeus TaxID=2760803 RepID=A0ABR8KRQ3_9SPHN|nr:hypothetical protein [Erythrobacter rubeus]MBD2840851.1 hypothetical protein [Erythrobacter rubeus]